MPMHALYKGDAADAALLYKNVTFNETSAKRYINYPLSTIHYQLSTIFHQNTISNYSNNPRNEQPSQPKT